MIQHLLKEIGGIGIYGIISVCLFFAIFSVMLIWAFQLKKSFLKSMESLPFEDAPPRPLQSHAISKGERRHE